MQGEADMLHLLVRLGWAKDACGYLARRLVLCTFSVTSMRGLRCIGITSNITFIGYAAMTHIAAILILHGLLLPMNIYRLFQIGQLRDGTQGSAS
jgi:hypothetical protein